MKKLISILLALCLCLSVGVMLASCDEECQHVWDEGEITTAATPDADGEKTFTCTLCGETKTEPVEYVVQNTVTEAEWTASFLLGDNFVIEASSTFEGLGRENFREERNGNLFKGVTSTTYFDSGVTDDETYNFHQIVDNKVWSYIPAFSGSHELLGYNKNQREETPAEFVEKLLSDYIPTALRDFSDFSYNEETNKYECEEVGSFSSAWLYFEDGKLISLHAEMVSSGTTITFDVSFAYGTAGTIEMPTNLLS